MPFGTESANLDLLLTPSVFFSYRRSDAGGYAQLLYSKMHEHVDARELFLDVVWLAPGCDFERELYPAIDRSSGMIAVIGPDWARGISEPSDWVRREVLRARECNKPILPVCVGGASPPEARIAADDIGETVAGFRERCVHLSPHEIPCVRPIAQWIDELGLVIEVAGVRFGRNVIPPDARGGPTTCYISEDILPAYEWRARLSARLAGLHLAREYRRSSPAAATGLVTELNGWVRGLGVSGVTMDIPYVDELERAAMWQEQWPARRSASAIITAEPQLCRLRDAPEFETIRRDPRSRKTQRQAIGLRGVDHPLRLVLRRR